MYTENAFKAAFMAYKARERGETDFTQEEMGEQALVPLCYRRDRLPEQTPAWSIKLQGLPNSSSYLSSQAFTGDCSVV